MAHWLVTLRGRPNKNGGAITFHDRGSAPVRFVLGPAPWPSLARVRAGDTIWLATRSVADKGATWLLLGSLEVADSAHSEAWVKPQTWWLAGRPRLYSRPRKANDLLARLLLAHGRGLGEPERWARVTGRPVALSPADAKLLGRSRRALLPVGRSLPQSKLTTRLLGMLERTFGKWEETEDGDMVGWRLPGHEGVRLFVDPEDRVHLVALRPALDAKFLDSLVDALILGQSKGIHWRIQPLAEGNTEVGVVIILTPGAEPAATTTDPA
ncbi:hypothetical protein IIA16_02865 [bacterium]|nr:hypothetical protein [bacterium]